MSLQSGDQPGWMFPPHPMGSGRAAAQPPAGQGLPWQAPLGRAKRSAAEDGAVPQEASEARGAGHSAKASGIEARQGRDATGGSMRSTKARPARAPLRKID